MPICAKKPQSSAHSPPQESANLLDLLVLGLTALFLPPPQVSRNGES